MVSYGVMVAQQSLNLLVLVRIQVAQILMMNPDFHKFYLEQYGDRWETLLKALLQEGEFSKLKFSSDLEAYYLDPASVFVAETLEVKPGQQVLDMCAAPGGKSLILAKALQGNGSLQLNDRSKERLHRLRRVLDNSLPKSLKSIIQITNFDASRFGLHRKNFFDRILLDAPCSSEQHVLKSPKHLKEWTKSRSKRLAVEQGSLLASAVDALQVKGIVVYSTCALSSLENDAVIHKILKKRKGSLRVILDFPILEGAERTEYGVHILPDRAKGMGPIYCAKLQKI